MTEHKKAATCSICIANYNGINLIDACIQSVLKQDFEECIEIIVHDDASTDESVAYIKKHYPSVVLIISETNVGFCVSNNRMVEASHGQYILLLNNDAELFPDAIKTFYEKAQKLGQPAILGIPQFDAANNRLIDIGSTFDLFLNPIPNINKDREEVGMIIGACLWLPRPLWDEIGGFPEWFGSLAEDMYLCLLARLYGYQVLALPTSGFRHWVGKSLGGGKVINNRLSSKLSRRIVSERNKTFTMILTYPTPALQLLLPLHLVLLLLEGAAIACIKLRWVIFTDVYWSCVVSQWQCATRLRKTRENIQGKRKISVKGFFDVFQKFPHKISLLWKHGIPQIN